MRLKLFPKVFILLTLLSILPVAIVGLRTVNINREGMQAAILELHTHLAASLADYVQDYLRSLDREIQYLARTLGTQMNWNDRQSVLQAFLDINENLVSVSITGRDGQELLKAYNPDRDKDPRLLTRAVDPTFKLFWQGKGQAALGSVYLQEHDPRIDIVYPLGSGHCLYTTISLQKLWERIIQTRIASTGYAFLVNAEGEIIAHPQAELSRQRTKATDLPIVTQVIKAVAVGSSEYVHPQTRKEIVGAYAPVKGLNWGVIIQQDKTEAYLSVYRMKRQAMTLILASLLSAALLALFLARSLTRPLVKLTDAARLIARKDFSVRVNVRTRDELQDLAETFNDMTTELERYDAMQVDKIVHEKTKTEAVIFSIADGMLMTDGEGRLQLINRYAMEILGIPETGWQDRQISAVIKDAEIQSTLTDIITKAQSHQDTGCELHLNLKGFDRYYALSSREVITPERKEKIGIVTVLRNITLEKELEKMKDDFLHSITHDLRNPMTSIRGFMKFLIDGVAGPLNDQQKKMLDTMDRASNRLLGLINDILDIAKLESGRMVIALSEIDLKSLAQRTIEIAEGQALKKAIRLVVEAPDDLPKAHADPELMERVFANLVGNALKFTPENGRVAVRMELAGNDIKISVIDTGEGIPPEYISRIFDKFQQVAGQRKGGTGLGLTICKHIVEAHLGRIWAESEMGQGARFIFAFPLNLTADMIMTSQLPAHADQAESKPDRTNGAAGA